MTTPEGKIEKHLKKQVEASGGKVRKLKWIGKSGAPDRLIWWPAIEPRTPLRMALVEIKAPGKKPTKVQELEHIALRQDGFSVFVVDSIESADEVIKRVYTGKPDGEAQPPRSARSSTDHIDVKSPSELPHLIHGLRPADGNWEDKPDKIWLKDAVQDNSDLV